jgi:ATP-dependent DNA helicase RecG
LGLEASRGFADTAVEGGLGPFMQRWAERAARNAATETARQALLDLGVVFGRYAGGSRDEREGLVRRAQDAVRALERSAPKARQAAGEPAPLPLTAHVTDLHGVSDRRAALLSGLGVYTLRDLLRHTPLRYEDRRQIVPLSSLTAGQTAAVSVEVTGPGEVARRAGMTVSEVPVRDGSGEGRVAWFNQPYRATQYPAGAKLLCTGMPRVVGGVVSVHVQECEVLGASPALHMQRIVPIYPTTQGLSQPLLRTLVDQALRRTQHVTEDPLPPSVREARGLLPAVEARRALHFPHSMGEAEAARRRAAFEELFVLQTLLAMRRRWLHDAAEGTALEVPAGRGAEFAASLPFSPTSAQERVLAAVEADLCSSRPAMRLIHGDVGSGKTAVAAFALLCAVKAGRQAAFMAPTEILAEQHRRVLEALLKPSHVRPVLLTANLPARDKERIRAGLAAGDIPLVVGTHALVQGATQFADLAVAVVDEQHRFGVLQRAALAGKGPRPHLFVMTATPIPRTLALVLYGDCDISVLDELPTGRRPPLTVLQPKPDRERAYQAVLEAVGKGRQAFIVCPLIEESESVQADAARLRHEELTEGILKGLRVGLLHGRLRADIAASVVDQFRTGALDVLVATTVIEVGVDVPAATVMVIEDAERFGLAQLHQLRGRVGRGDERGTCYLITSATHADPAWARLSLLESTSDGFQVAEADLRMRGPGQLIGTRQAGLPDLRLADVLGDTLLIEQAREDAFALIAADPTLTQPDHAALRHLVHHHTPTLLPLLRGD